MSPCMNERKGSLKRIASVAAVIVAIAAAAVFFAVRTSPVCLVLRDADTGKRIAAFRLPDDGAFSVRFIHSVNKSPVEEFYEARNTELFVTGCVYESLGAGVETQTQKEERMQIGEEGDLLYTGIERNVDPLIYIVGTKSDHELIIGGSRISLTALCGKNARVLFEAKRACRGRDPSGYSLTEPGEHN